MHKPMETHHCRHGDGRYSLRVQLEGFALQTSSWPRPGPMPSPHSELVIYDITPTRILELGTLIIQEAHVILLREATAAEKPPETPTYEQVSKEDPDG